MTINPQGKSGRVDPTRDASPIFPALRLHANAASAAGGSCQRSASSRPAMGIDWRRTSSDRMGTGMTSQNFVTTEWLSAHLKDPGLARLAASRHLPPTGGSAAAEFRAGDIPGAVFFDIDAIADTSSGLPH